MQLPDSFPVPRPEGHRLKSCPCHRDKDKGRDNTPLCLWAKYLIVIGTVQEEAFGFFAVRSLVQSA